MLRTQKECPICKSHGITNNLRLCQINYTEGVYACSNELCSYPGNYTWEYVTRNLFEDSDNDGNISEEVERDILTYAKKRKQMENEAVMSSGNKYPNSVVSESTPHLIGDQNEFTIISFDASTVQVSDDNINSLHLNTNKIIEEPFKSELKCDVNNDIRKERISTETCGIDGNKSKRDKFDIKSVVIYNNNNKNEFKEMINALKLKTLNNININDNTKNAVVCESEIKSPNSKTNPISIPVKLIKFDKVDASKLSSQTNKKINLNFLNQPTTNSQIALKEEDLNILNSVKQPLILSPIKQPLILSPVKQPLILSPVKQPLILSPVKQPLILSPIKRQGHVSKKEAGNINLGFKNNDLKGKMKHTIQKKLPLKIIENIDVGSESQSMILSPIKKNIIMGCNKNLSDILNIHNRIIAGTEEGAAVSETKITESNLDLKKFVNTYNNQKNASNYSGFTFKNRRRVRKKTIHEADNTKNNIELHSNVKNSVPSIKQEYIIVEEIAANESILPPSSQPVSMEVDEKCGNQELDDMLGEFLQNVDLADLNQTNLSTNCGDLTEWLDAL